jgi:hypothetical protein
MFLKNLLHARRWLAVCSIAILLGSCLSESKTNINLAGLNYTDNAIAEFSVDGYGGGSIFANGGGGQFVCCVALPRTWRSDIKVVVRWTEDGGSSSARKQLTVAVPRYGPEDIGFFAVHFYPGDVVKVLVTTKIEGHPNYPYPRPK